MKKVFAYSFLTILTISVIGGYCFVFATQNTIQNIGTIIGLIITVGIVYAINKAIKVISED